MADENRYQPLRDFAKVPPDQQEAFVSWLEHATPRPGIGDLGFWAYFELQKKGYTPAINFSGLLENIATLANAQVQRNELLEIASTEICKVREDEKERFSQLLGRAIERKRVIELSIKAGAILWRQGRVLADANSITQIRPVFEGDPVQLAGNALVHEMQIEYFENGKKHSTTFLMDDYRLDLLQQAIDRAKAKEKAIRSTALPDTLF